MCCFSTATLDFAIAQWQARKATVGIGPHVTRGLHDHMREWGCFLCGPPGRSFSSVALSEAPWKENRDLQVHESLPRSA